MRRSAFTSYVETLRSSGLHVVRDDVRTNGFNFEGKEQAWSVNRDSRYAVAFAHNFRHAHLYFRWLGGTDTLWEGSGVGTLGSFEMVVSGAFGQRLLQLQLD